MSIEKITILTCDVCGAKKTLKPDFDGQYSVLKLESDGAPGRLVIEKNVCSNCVWKMWNKAARDKF